MTRLLLALVFLVSVRALACGNHPGMTHEQWTSAVRDERNAKTGAVVVVSDSFFSSPAPGNEAPSDNSRSADRGERRPQVGR